jgi:signal transduction histidine kinase
MEGGAGRFDWRLSRREAALVAGFWALLALLSIVNRIADPRGPGIHLLPPSAPVILVLVESALWTALTPVVFGLASRFSLSGRGWLWRVPPLLLGGLAIAAFAHVAVELLRVHVLEFPRRRATGTIPAIQPLRFLNDFVIYVGVLAAGLAREYFRRYREQTQAAARLATEASDLRARLAEARLLALRTQLNPHFLFNTLHAISALVERDPAGVRRMIARLSELLRATLEDTSAERTVESEMAFVARYLEIMAVRFQGALAVETEVDPQAARALVPSLVLQPLVENAVRHGLPGQRGRLAVSARRDGGRVVLSVRDDGPGPPPDWTAGVGLSNTEARLRQMYGRAARLGLERGPAGGAVAEVVLPFREAPAAG